MNNSSSEETCNVTILSSPTALPLMFGLLANIFSTITLTAVSRKNKVPLTLKLISYNDLFNCVVYVGYIIFNTYTCDRFSSSPICVLGGVIGMASMLWSMHLVGIMSVERLFMIVKPIFHKNNCGGKNLYIIIPAIILLISDLLFFLLPVFGFALPYTFYETNKVCLVVLVASKTNVQQNIYILLLSFNIISSTFGTAGINLVFAYKLDKKNKIQTTLRAYKKDKQSHISLLVKILAVVNCCFNIPVGVS